jgi:hypothetical protein
MPVTLLATKGDTNMRASQLFKKLLLGFGCGWTFQSWTIDSDERPCHSGQHRDPDHDDAIDPD